MRMQFIRNSNIQAAENEIDINFLTFLAWPHLGSKQIIVCKYNPDNPDYYIDTSFKISIFNV